MFLMEHWRSELIEGVKERAIWQEKNSGVFVPVDEKYLETHFSLVNPEANPEFYTSFPQNETSLELNAYRAKLVLAGILNNKTIKLSYLNLLAARPYLFFRDKKHVKEGDLIKKISGNKGLIELFNSCPYRFSLVGILHISSQLLSKENRLGRIEKPIIIKPGTSNYDEISFWERKNSVYSEQAEEPMPSFSY